MRVVDKVYALGIMSMVLAGIISSHALSMLMYDVLNFFCLLCLLPLMFLSKALKRRLEGEKAQVASIVWLTLSTLLVIAYLRMAVWLTFGV